MLRSNLSTTCFGVRSERSSNACAHSLNVAHTAYFPGLADDSAANWNIAPCVASLWCMLGSVEGTDCPSTAQQKAHGLRRASDAQLGRISGGMGKLPAMPPPPYTGPVLGGGRRTSCCAAAPAAAASCSAVASLDRADEASACVAAAAWDEPGSDAPSAEAAACATAVGGLDAGEDASDAAAEAALP